MAKFIELTGKSGEKCLVAVDKVVTVGSNGVDCGTFIEYALPTKSGKISWGILVKESYDEVKAMLLEASK